MHFLNIWAKGDVSNVRGFSFLKPLNNSKPIKYLLLLIISLLFPLLLHIVQKSLLKVGECFVTDV